MSVSGLVATAGCLHALVWWRLGDFLVNSTDLWRLRDASRVSRTMSQDRLTEKVLESAEQRI
jgi:hypothetical protein